MLKNVMYNVCSLTQSLLPPEKPRGDVMVLMSTPVARALFDHRFSERHFSIPNNSLGVLGNFSFEFLRGIV